MKLSVTMAIVSCHARLSAPRRRPARRAIGPAPLAAALLCLIIASYSNLSAQYFGRNKVRYEDFDFKVMQTQHFDIHYYPEEEQAVRDAARMAERWYERLSGFFGHSFTARKPMVLYANQGDFQQTFIISEMIGEGTGGFTEPLQDRVVLPLTGWYAANDHVIGHELVHAFQYDMVAARGEEGLQAMGALPLWFIEGMAEYLSIGRDDPNTAMWLRDVMLRDEIPTIDEISRNSRYFPYRYGQAIWAYIGGRWGDDMIPKLYRAALTGGMEMAIKRQLGITVEELSKEWIAAIKSMYAAEVASRSKPADVGRATLGDGDHDMEVSPAISPDGKKVAFLSSRELFTIDLYVADIATGDVDKLLSTQSNPHLDAIRFINSAGAWSPDGKKFATVVYVQGNDELQIVDIASGDADGNIAIKEVGEISNPTWSPDGKEIAFTGSHGGISDIYVVEVATKRVRRLTNDRYADMHPSWSPDGSTIAFSTDRGPETDFTGLRYSPLRLALLDVRSGAVTILPRFTVGKNINPQYSPDGRDLYFVADPDGFSNVYRYTIATNEIARVTNVATGISGISAQSPAISVARTSGTLIYSVFDKGGYMMRMLDASEARGTPVAPEASPALIGGMLPPPPGGTVSSVATYLVDSRTGLPAVTDYPVRDYSPTLRLDYLGTPTVGVAVGAFGTGFAGGISGFFSDLLGYHQLAATVQMNGSIEDIGAQAQYLYTRNRWNWGVGVSHIPYLSYGTRASRTTFEPPGGNPVDAIAYEEIFQRVFEDQLQLIGAYPFSTTRRMELTAGYTRISYNVQSTSSIVVNNTIVAQVDTSYPTPPGLNLLQGGLAYVGDNSFFGFTSPVAGERFRFEVGGTAGSLKFGTVLLDYRKYFFANPVTFAVRGLHYGRYGSGGESEELTPLFIGYESMVRGYSSTSFDIGECTGDDCPEFTRLIGSRIAVASAEIRTPLFGVNGYGLLNFPFLPTDIALFADGGTAWTSSSSPMLRFDRNTTDRVPVFSAGVSARVNLFGYMVLEIFYAYPFQRPLAGWQWGFQIAPGW